MKIPLAHFFVSQCSSDELKKQRLRLYQRAGSFGWQGAEIVFTIDVFQYSYVRIHIYLYTYVFVYIYIHMYYRNCFPPSVPQRGGPVADARTKNNLRFIEMQRGEPLVILFHRHRRRRALWLTLFGFLSFLRAALIRPVFFVSPFVRNGMARKCGKRITIERQQTDRRQRDREREREQVERRKAYGMSPRRS